MGRMVRMKFLGRSGAGACPNLPQSRSGPGSAARRSAEYQRLSSGAPAGSGTLWQKIWTTCAAAGPGKGAAGRAAPAATTSTTAAAPRERRSGAGPRRPARSRMSRPSPGPVGTPPILRERVGFQSNAHLPSARSTGNLRAHEERRTGVGAGRQGRSRSRGRRGRRRRRCRGPFRSPEWGLRRGMIAGARARGPTPGPRRPPPVAVGTDHRGPPLPEPNAGDRGRHCRRSPLPEVTADRRPPAGGRTFGYNV